MSKPLDIINLPYPMFPVTEEEKDILRKCEMLYALGKNQSWGLCSNVLDVSDYSEIGCRLKQKVSMSLDEDWFLEDFLRLSWPQGFSNLSGMLRRVWITKLLNQVVL